MADTADHQEDSMNVLADPKVASSRSSFLMHRKHSVVSTFDFDDDDDDDGGEDSWSSGAEDSDDGVTNSIGDFDVDDFIERQPQSSSGEPQRRPTGVVLPKVEQGRFEVCGSSDNGISDMDVSLADLPPPVEYPVPSTEQIRILLALHPDTQAHIILTELYGGDVTEAQRQQQIEYHHDLAEARRLTDAEVLSQQDLGNYYVQRRSKSTSPRKRLGSKVTIIKHEGVHHSHVDSIVEAGWLYKRGGGTRKLGSKRYKKRWFELVHSTKGLYLTYQCDMRDGALKGAIQMSCARVDDTERTKTTFFVHISNTKGQRSFHLKAPSMAEKHNWLRALNSSQPIPRRSTILAKGLDLFDLPILAGYLRTESRGGPRELKPKDRWIELWDKGENRGAFLLFLESPGEIRGRLELTLQDAMVMDDFSEDSVKFFILWRGGEYTFTSPFVSKTKWVEPLAKRTGSGMVMEKNTGRRTSMVNIVGGRTSAILEDTANTAC
eukprot:m.318400 g.318400  ORF g.318400 m.318400 type:complete len:492 (-) comp20289_c0_seq5:2279-3754(-)